LNGVDLRDVSLDDLRRSVGLVTQEIQLFHATVRDNLALYDPAISDAQIWRVLGELGLEEWCRRLPDELGTVLAPGGGGLSAGESQLLVFARVFLRDPGLVILDEASSRMDSVTTRHVERALNRLLIGRTAIVIAHRLETVERADTIVILQNGVIQEYGAREQLALNPESQFARLLRVGLEGMLV
jgi:ABC-type multidrug transport system fused ATPase/permease subunit